MRTLDEPGLAARLRVLRSPLFLLSLGALLANDLYLKGEFSNFITGKLSDVAGLLVVSSLAFALLRQSPRVVAGLIAITFVWWKSPLSDPFIAFINTLSPFRLGRVVDYTDVVALLVLPVALHTHRVDERPATADALSPALRWPLLALTAFAISGTSALPLVRQFTIRPQTAGTALSDNTVEQIATPILERHGCEMHAPRRCESKRFFVEYATTESEVSFTVNGTMPLFGSKRYERDAERLVTELKEAFAEVPGLEFVENLDCRGRPPTDCGRR